MPEYIHLVFLFTTGGTENLNLRDGEFQLSLALRCVCMIHALVYALPYSSECNEYTATTLYKLVLGELVDSVCLLGQNWSKICYLPQN